MAALDILGEAIRSGDANRSVELTREAIDASIPPKEILNCMVDAMDEIGRRFQCGDAFVPEMLFSSRAMRASVELLEPLLARAGVKPDFTAVIGTVQGDLHDLGKDLVIMMWRGANFEVIDLGVDVRPNQFIEAAKEHQAQLIGLSSLLTTTMPAMKMTVEAIRAADLDGIKTVVGGAPVSQEFADAIGANAYAADAVTAVEVARGLMLI